MNKPVRWIVTAAICGVLTLPASAQQNPLYPQGWTDLYVYSRGVGFFINAQRMCGVHYDQEVLNAEIAREAASINVSVAKLLSEGQKRADEAVPFVTRDTCNVARKEGKRNGWIK